MKLLENIFALFLNFTHLYSQNVYSEFLSIFHLVVCIQHSTFSLINKKFSTLKSKNLETHLHEAHLTELNYMHLKSSKYNFLYRLLLVFSQQMPSTLRNINNFQRLFIHNYKVNGLFVLQILKNIYCTGCQKKSSNQPLTHPGQIKKLS